MGGHETQQELNDGGAGDVSSEEGHMIEVVKQENYSEAEKFNSNRELIDNGSVRPRSD